MQTPARLLLILGALLLTGCSSYTAPAMHISDARLTDRTDHGVALAFVMEATNANPEPLPLRRATYSLELDGKRVFRGVRSAEATLRQKGTQLFVLPAGVAATDLPTGVVKYRLTGDVQYVTPGAFAEVLFDTGVRRPKAPFVQEGTIDLSAAPSPVPSLLPPLTPAEPDEPEGE
jgi:hypothetical protein